IDLQLLPQAKIAANALVQLVLVRAEVGRKLAALAFWGGPRHGQQDGSVATAAGTILGFFPSAPASYIVRTLLSALKCHGSLIRPAFPTEVKNFLRRFRRFYPLYDWIRIDAIRLACSL